jgi:hypothetical protein
MALKNNLLFENQIKSLFQIIGTKQGKSSTINKCLDNLLIQLKKTYRQKAIHQLNINSEIFFDEIIMFLSAKVHLKHLSKNKNIPILLNKQKQQKNTLKSFIKKYQSEKNINSKNISIVLKKIFQILNNEKRLLYQNWEKEKYTFYKNIVRTN